MKDKSIKNNCNYNNLLMNTQVKDVDYNIKSIKCWGGGWEYLPRIKKYIKNYCVNQGMGVCS